MREINLTNFRRMLEDLINNEGLERLRVPIVLTQKEAQELLEVYKTWLWEQIVGDMLELRKLGNVFLGKDIHFDEEDTNKFIETTIDNAIEELNRRYDLFTTVTDFGGEQLADVCIDRCGSSALPNLIEFENIVPTNNCRELNVCRNGKLVYSRFIDGNCENLVLECEDILREILPANEKYTYGIDIIPSNPGDSFYFTAPVKGLGDEIIKYVIEIKPKSSFFECFSTLENSEDECETYLVVGLDFSDTTKFIVTNISKTISITEEITRLNSEGIIKQVSQVVKVNQNTLGVVANLTL